MEIDKRVFALSGIITILLFSSIILFNIFLNEKRVDVVMDRIDDLVEGYDELTAISLLSDVLGEESTCLALESSLVFMNEGVWDIGKRIEDYRRTNERFADNPVYIKLKRRFNREEIIYFSILEKMRQQCGIDKTVVLYFFRNSKVCALCDSQAFVITDLRRDIGDELAVFSFDADLNIPSVNILRTHYNVSDYPCVVVEGKAYCGSLYNKDDLIDLLCDNGENLSVCN